MCLVALGSVFRDRGRLMSRIASHVRSNPLAAVKDLDRGRGVTCFQLFAYELVGDAVVMTFDLNVVINVGANQLPMRENVRFSG